MENNNQNKLNANVDIKTLPSLTCDECKCESFINAYIIKRVSPLLTETGKPGFLPIPTFACSHCGHVNVVLDPTKTNNIINTNGG